MSARSASCRSRRPSDRGRDEQRGPRPAGHRRDLAPTARALRSCSASCPTRRRRSRSTENFNASNVVTINASTVRTPGSGPNGNSSRVVAAQRSPGRQRPRRAVRSTSPPHGEGHDQSHLSSTASESRRGLDPRRSCSCSRVVARTGGRGARHVRVDAHSGSARWPNDRPTGSPAPTERWTARSRTSSAASGPACSSARTTR